MAQDRPTQFLLLRYVPCGGLVADEFVNIGLVLLEEPESRTGFCGFRFASNWQKVQSVDPDADVELLDALMRDLQTQLQSPKRQELLRTMHDSFSNTIQLSDWKQCPTDDPEKELDILASRYI